MSDLLLEDGTSKALLETASFLLLEYSSGAAASTQQQLTMMGVGG